MGDASNPAPAAGTSSDGWVRTVLRRLSGDHLLVLALVLLAAGLFLNQAEFVPNLRDLNMWDEAAWIQSGRSLLTGWLPTVGSSPLVSILYALTCLPFLDSPFWLIHSASLGRLILFGLLWLSAYRIARQLPTPGAAILLGMVFVSPLFTSLLRFPSDPLYSALAGLGLAEVLAFRTNHNLRHAWGSSALVGLAALARNDGVLLALVLVPLLLLLAPRDRRWRTLLASALPAAALIGVVILISGLPSGTFALGTFGRTYDNFESGQQVVYQGTGERNAVIEARLEARRLFGTPEENHYSVWNAIRRNPPAYLARVKAIAIGLPSVFLEAYNKRLGAAFVVLAAAGFLTLVRRREIKLLVALVAFTLPILSAFVITIVRLGHLQLWWFSVYVLAAIGLSELVGGLGRLPAAVTWSVVWGAVAVYGVADNKLAIYYTAAVMLAALWIGFILARRERASAAAVLLSVFLPAGLILRGSFPSPKIRQLGVAGDEQAVLYLREHFPPGTLVATGIPGLVQMAGMTPATLSSTDVPQFDDPAEVVRWMREQGMQAVYVDAGLYADNPALWSLIEAEIGAGFKRVFVAEEGNYQVLLVTPP
jgi:hypothetical protein